MAPCDDRDAMGLDKDMIVAGIGTRKGVEAAEVVTLIERAAADASLNVTDIGAIATAAAKAAEPGIVAAAAALGLPVLSVYDADLQNGSKGGVTQSSCSKRLFSVSSVSEAAALAAAGTGSTLLLSRIKSARVTCALAHGAAT